MLEPRVLLSTYLFADQGSATANATAIQSVVNGGATNYLTLNGNPGTYTIAKNDVVQINPASQFLFTTGTGNTPSLTIPSLNFAAGSGTITIETSAVTQQINGRLLPTGRISPSDGSLLVRFFVDTANTGAITTTANAHDFAFIGLEVMPKDNTTSADYTSLIKFGDNTSAQSTSAMVPANFVIDRCYLHGWAGTASQHANLLHGVAQQRQYYR